jgi:hypothetical protein
LAAGYAIAATVLYPIGVPLALLAILSWHAFKGDLQVRFRALIIKFALVALIPLIEKPIACSYSAQHPSTVLSFGFLYDAYRSDVWCVSPCFFPPLPAT